MKINGNSNQSITKEIKIKQKGRLHAFVYWWKYNLNNKESIITYNDNYKNDKIRYYYNQSAYILNNKIVNENDQIILKCICKDNKIIFLTSQ